MQMAMAWEMRATIACLFQTLIKQILINKMEAMHVILVRLIQQIHAVAGVLMM